MKIGILTQPLRNNYGGLIQCYALQKVLKLLGHDVWVVQRDYNEPPKTFTTHVVVCVKQIVKVLIGSRLFKNIQPNRYIVRNTAYFATKYISPKTKTITSNESLVKCHLIYKFDAYVVGSDQVWRPRYSPCITNYFLDFLSSDDCVKRVAYAASFGVAEWEFSEEKTNICRNLLKFFDGISVRENSAVDMCAKYLGRDDALHVLDPTMLLEKEDYIRLVEKENEPKSDGNLFCYVLDKSEDKSHIIRTIAEEIKAKPFTRMPKCDITKENLKVRLEDCVFPTVTAWLRAFMDADLVVTDSFHGCVFSIIFNKPFWVIGNNERGLARFDSLLSLYGLQNRLINGDSMPIDVIAPIDWTRVNAIKKLWQQKSMEFLRMNL